MPRNQCELPTIHLESKNGNNGYNDVEADEEKSDDDIIDVYRNIDI